MMHQGNADFLADGRGVCDGPDDEMSLAQAASNRIRCDVMDAMKKMLDGLTPEELQKLGDNIEWFEFMTTKFVHERVVKRPQKAGTLRG